MSPSIFTIRFILVVAGGSDSEPLRGQQGGGLSPQQPHHVRGRGRGQDDQP